jgi:hypothetical protein
MLVNENKYLKFGLNEVQPNKKRLKYDKNKKVTTFKSSYLYQDHNLSFQSRL